MTALRRTDLDDAQALVTEIARELESHWRGEEGGLFAEMHGDDTYREYIDDLVKEHRELQELLTSADLARADDRLEVAKAMEELYDHIAKEEDGLFPASLTALSGEQWDRSIAAWQDAHADHPVGAPDRVSGSR